MSKVNSYFCFKTFYMISGAIAFEKGKFYKGRLNSSRGTFKSDVSSSMTHTMDVQYVNEHLRLFKFGR